MSTLSELEQKRDYYNSLSDTELDEAWATRAQREISEDEENMLRYIVRGRKGFKAVQTNVPMCKRCNLPVNNCACMNP